VPRRPRLAAVTLTLTLTSALALGCGGGDAFSGDWIMFDACAPLAILPDATVTAEQSNGILAGMALWNDRAGTRLTLAPGGGPPGVPLHFQSAAPNFHGLYDAPRGEVFINDDLSGAPLAITIAHEIGHVFGLTHVPPDERTSVMNPNNLVVEPTPEDVDTLANRWGVCLASAHP
jgi:hypothetical protein